MQCDVFELQFGFCSPLAHLSPLCTCVVCVQSPSAPVTVAMVSRSCVASLSLLVLVCLLCVCVSPACSEEFAGPYPHPVGSKWDQQYGIPIAGTIDCGPIVRAWRRTLRQDHADWVRGKTGMIGIMLVATGQRTEGYFTKSGQATTMQKLHA